MFPRSPEKTWRLSLESMSCIAAGSTSQGREMGTSRCFNRVKDEADPSQELLPGALRNLLKSRCETRIDPKIWTVTSSPESLQHPNHSFRNERFWKIRWLTNTGNSISWEERYYVFLLGSMCREWATSIFEI